MRRKDSPGIVILGMHRSGTSLIAKLTARWGAYGNEAAMLGPDESNPEGHWEYAPLVYLNDELLRAVDSRWNVPPRDSHKELLRALGQESEFRTRAIRLMAEMRTEGRPWFWKDPRLSVLLPFWQEIWGSVVYVVVTRDPSDIAVSLKTRDTFTTLTSFSLWERYLSEIMTDTQIRSRACFTSYELLLTRPLQECGRLCRYLDKEFEFSGSDQDRRAEVMAAAIRRDLWRSHARPFAQNPLATHAQKELYRAALRRSEPLAGDWPEVSSLDAGWREQLALADNLLQTVGPDRCQLFWRSSNDRYEERKSISILVQEGNPQSIQLAFPPDQVAKRLFLRVDFSRRPGFLHLMEMSVKTPAGHVVWKWNGLSRSLQDCVRNQIEVCGETPPPQGCLLRLHGDDPWIEIALDISQSIALAGGGTLAVACIYLSPEQALLSIRSGITAEIMALRAELGRLRGSNASQENGRPNVEKASA
jgi:hypothetical protein